MNLQQLNPKNWFKSAPSTHNEIPVTRIGSELKSVPGGRTRHPMLRLHNEIDRLFDEAFSGFSWPGFDDFRKPEWWGPMANTPHIDVIGDQESYQVQLDVPGLRESDLSVEVQGNSLIIKGSKQESDESKDKKFYRVERRYGEFQRALALPEDADAEQITATLKQGVLSLTIPRKALPEPEVKKIAIH